LARIAGVDLPRDKRIEVALTYIYGIGRSTSSKILAKTQIDPNTRVRDLTEEEANRLREVIEREYTVEGDLRRIVQMNIKRLMDIGTYRGLRHRRGLAGEGTAHPHQRPDPQRPKAPHRPEALRVSGLQSG